MKKFSVDLTRDEIQMICAALHIHKFAELEPLKDKFDDLLSRARKLENHTIEYSHELKTGMVVYHVYGRKSYHPTREVVVKAPYHFEMDGEVYFAFDVKTEDGEVRRRMVADCGLNGADYNYNRLFYSYEAGQAYIEQCIAKDIHRN